MAIREYGVILTLPNADPPPPLTTPLVTNFVRKSDKFNMERSKPETPSILSVCDSSGEGFKKYKFFGGRHL